MREKPIKVLLVEDDLEDVALFEEALAEIDENLYTRKWMQACELLLIRLFQQATICCGGRHLTFSTDLWRR